jgi:hypothetical protein
MTDDEEGAERQVTTATRYHAVLLLSLTDPFSLAEGEIDMLHDVLTRHAGLCRVIPGSHRGSGAGGLYCVDLRGSEPPEVCSRLYPDEDAVEPYLLDAREALQAIREQLERTSEKVREQSPEAIILRALLPQGSSAQRRREARHPDSRWVQLLPGLEPIHDWLTGDDAGERQAFTALTSNCRVVDTSEHGMGLAWEDDGAEKARVGELLLVLEEDSPPGLAVVRWVRIQGEGDMKLGIQRIHGRCAPVTCRPDDDGDAEAVPALSMPACGEEQVAATIIAPKGLYEPGRRLLIDVAGSELHARAGRCVFEGPVFERFEFSPDNDE